MGEKDRLGRRQRRSARHRLPPGLGLQGGFGGGEVDAVVDAARRDLTRRPEGDVLRVSVRDEGPGVAEADMPRLFTDFGQLDAGLAKRAEGAGLGLSICRRIVEGLGGRIGVESAPGAGSTFSFEIPARLSDEAPPAEPAPRPDLSLAGRRILVAEDNPISAKVSAGYLALLHADQDRAADGAEAVRLADSRRYDLILMDVAMPGMDGVSATGAIRAGAGPSRTAPVIGFTAHVMPSILADCLAVGMADVLAKPIGFDAFAARLARHLAADGVNAERRDGAGVDLAPRRRAAGDRVARDDLLREFRRDSAYRISILREAVRRGDPATITAEAHRIRGAAGLLGACEAHEVATAIEEGARHLDPEDLREAVENLSAAIGSFCRSGG